MKALQLVWNLACMIFFALIIRYVCPPFQHHLEKIWNKILDHSFPLPGKLHESFRNPVIECASKVVAVQVGSSSVRLIYLPDNAHIILVGGAEVGYPDLQIPPHAADVAFRECNLWSKLRYVAPNHSWSRLEITGNALGAADSQRVLKAFWYRTNFILYRQLAMITEDTFLSNRVSWNEYFCFTVKH